MPTEHDRELRTKALSAFLDERVAEGFRVERRTDTHAIIVLPRFADLLGRLRAGGRNRRQVVSVDEHGVVTALPAEPIRW